MFCKMALWFCALNFFEILNEFWAFAIFCCLLIGSKNYKTPKRFSLKKAELIFPFLSYVYVVLCHSLTNSNLSIAFYGGKIESVYTFSSCFMVLWIFFHLFFQKIKLLAGTNIGRSLLRFKIILLFLYLNPCLRL